MNNFYLKVFMQIAIRCDGSREIGMGHIYRGINLARCLISSDFKVTFFIKPNEASIKKLTQEGFDFRIIFSDGEFLKALPEEGYPLVIFDVRDTEKEYLKKIKEKGIRIISFDDRGSGSYLADLLIDANREGMQNNNSKQDEQKRCFGAEFMVLGEEFHAFWKKEKGISDRVRTILISMGGSDPLDLSKKLLEALMPEQKGLSIRLVLGPAYANKEGISLCLKHFSNIKIITDAKDMAELMYTSDLIYCSGGITLYEAMAMGIPAVVLSQNEHQRIIGDSFQKKGVIKHLGIGSKVSDKSIISALNINRKERTVMTKKGKEIVDGKGLERVKEEIIELSDRINRLTDEIEDLVAGMTSTHSENLKKILYS